MSLRIECANRRQEEIAANLTIGKEPETVRNPFSGETAVLCPEAVALYDFIKGAEHMGGGEHLVEGLNMFRANWPEAYMTLLD
jgi:hypothetical protein